MKKTRLAVISIGCVCALNANAAALDADIASAEQPADFAFEQSQTSRYENWAHTSALSADERASISGLGFQFDAGSFDTAHKITGTWPSAHWLGRGTTGASMASVGYRRRNVSVEGAVFRANDSDQQQDNELVQLVASAKRLKRLSFKFHPNLALRISRGWHVSPDQLHLQKIRRTTASATYSNSIGGNPWDTVLAVGRGRGVAGSTGNMYLLESAMRVGTQHTFFGRAERGNNDELFREEDGPRQQVYQVSKYTLGYLYDVKRTGPAKLGIGGLVSRHAVPNELLPYYGSKDTSYMVFLRLQMQFAAN